MKSQMLDKLREISDKFTEDTLTSIFSSMCNETDVKVVNCHFGEASAKGDSYLSVVNKVKVDGFVKDKPVQIALVIKSLPRNIGRRKTYRSTEFFRNEIIFYTNVVPKFEQFLEEKNALNLLCIPRHLASLTDGENDYLVMEDVNTLGFGPITRQNYINMEQCTIILEAMAKFHAISFAFKDQKPQEFFEIVNSLKETYFSPDYWSWYERFHKRLIEIATDALIKEYPNSTATKRFTSYKFGSLYEMCCNVCKNCKGVTSVVTQGDSWAPNFLMRDDKENQEALMLDFQLARCASPITDLSFFIYSCTDDTFRKQHFEDVLKIYHNKLCKVISSLGSDPEKLYSWNMFMKEVKEMFFFGTVFATEAVPFVIMDNSQAFDLDTLIKGDNAVNIADVWTLSNINSQNGRQRLASIIVHAVENGYL